MQMFVTYSAESHRKNQLEILTKIRTFGIFRRFMSSLTKPYQIYLRANFYETPTVLKYLILFLRNALIGTDAAISVTDNQILRNLKRLAPRQVYREGQR